MKSFRILVYSAVNAETHINFVISLLLLMNTGMKTKDDLDLLSPAICVALIPVILLLFYTLNPRRTRTCMGLVQKPLFQLTYFLLFFHSFFFLALDSASP